MLAGQPADDLDPAAGFAEGAFDEVGVSGSGPMLTGKPQVDGQRVAVSEQGPHRRGVGVAPALGERVDAVLGEFDRVQARLDVGGQVEDRLVVGFDVSLGILGHLGNNVAGAMN